MGRINEDKELEYCYAGPSPVHGKYCNHAKNHKGAHIHIIIGKRGSTVLEYWKTKEKENEE